MIHRNLTLTLVPRIRRTVHSAHSADGIAAAGTLEAIGALGLMPGRQTSQTHSLRLRKTLRTRETPAAHGRLAATRRTKKRPLLPTLTLETSAPLMRKKRRKRQKRAAPKSTMAGGPLAAARKTRRRRKRTPLKIHLAILSYRL